MKPVLAAGVTQTKRIVVDKAKHVRFVIDLAKQKQRLEAKAVKLAQLAQ